MIGFFILISLELFEKSKFFDEFLFALSSMRLLILFKLYILLDFILILFFGGGEDFILFFTFFLELIFF